MSFLCLCLVRSSLRNWLILKGQSFWGPGNQQLGPGGSLCAATWRGSPEAVQLLPYTQLPWEQGTSRWRCFTNTKVMICGEGHGYRKVFPPSSSGSSRLNITENPNPVLVLVPLAFCLELSVHLPEIVPFPGTKRPWLMLLLLLLLVGLICIHTYIYIHNLHSKNLFLCRPSHHALSSLWFSYMLMLWEETLYDCLKSFFVVFCFVLFYDSKEERKTIQRSVGVTKRWGNFCRN